MDIDKLLKALDNEKNESLINLTTEKIIEMNKRILKELKLPEEKYFDFIQKLENYKYVDEINELNYGSYIRWINITNPKKINLTKGAIFCDTKITDKGIILVCKGFYHTHFQIKMDDCLIFQCLKQDEKVLLNALNYLSKK
jgi:hypothetical protein